jgi:hypothetical protein
MIPAKTNSPRSEKATDAETPLVDFFGGVGGGATGTAADPAGRSRPQCLQTMAAS